MYNCYSNALDEYSNYNNAHVEHIIIFRDGVGDAMRQQVKSEELQMLRDLLKEKFPISQPKITLVIVNKRITQRFFEKTDYMEIKNPPAGTIIDSEVVYNTDNETKLYDFFLISQTTT